VRATGQERPVAALVPDSFVHAHADHAIDVVIERLAESGGVLPIVSRTDVHRVEGVVTPDSILNLRDRRQATSAFE
jgi:hypothetical protein